MIDYKYKDLFQQGSTDKQLLIESDGMKITNSELYGNEFELKESLCSSEQLTFGTCESSSVKFKIAYVPSSLKGKWLSISELIGGHTDAPFQIGRYKVYSDMPSGDRNYRNVTAYDAMYDIINADVAEWYNSLTFPLSLKSFRDSFFDYLRINQVETELVNDAMMVEQTINSTTISGKMVITAICEINGVFGHINRSGNFDYVRLEQKAEGLYPSNDLYPSNNLYPIAKKSTTISKSKYIDCEYEDYIVQAIDKVQIRQEENDIGAIFGTGDNCYIVQNNFLVYGKSESDLQSIAYNLLTVIKDITYRPFEADLNGDPCFEVGDPVKFYTRHEVVNSYILVRTMKGIQSLRDTFSADGSQKYEENVNSLNFQINQLRGKTNELIRNVEETKSTITDVEKELQTQITQNAEKIETKASSDELESLATQTAKGFNQTVKKGDVSSEISQEAGDITISANRIKISSDNFILEKDGSITAKNATIEGGDIVLVSGEEQCNFKILREDGSEAFFLTPGICNFKGHNGRRIAMSSLLGSIICYDSDDTQMATIGILNSFKGGLSVSDGVLRAGEGAEITGNLSVKYGDITINDEWYNGWTITECFKDLYDRVKALEGN